MKTIGMLGLLVALCSTTALADTTPRPIFVNWTFTASTGGWESNAFQTTTKDYSTNLDTEVATTLPNDLVKDGWSCSRKPLTVSGSRMDPKTMGEFFCSDGKHPRVAYATCSPSHVDTSNGNMLLLFNKNGREEWLTFQVSCQSSQ
jgi:hypothetical protein